MMNAVEVRNLCFKYRNLPDKILDNVNLSVMEGETIALLGGSGSGKTTFCNCLCGLIPNVYSGEFFGDVELFGENIKNMNMAKIVTKAGMIFQNPSTQLFSPTIEDELAFGPENLCVDRREIARRIDNILKTIDMEDYRYENPNNLSGGQQQLIAMASVLMLEPKILICDEIMSWVDQNGKNIIRNLLLKLKEEKKSIIIVDHDLENIKISDRVVQVRDGKFY
jgi:energy-coupling factor transport system ATP-binding protein